MSTRTVEGFAELRKALESLKTDAARTALRHASKKSAEIVKAEAASRAPHSDAPHWQYRGPKGQKTRYRLISPGFLSRNINVAVKYLSRMGAVKSRIGPARDAFYGTQFVEIGTSQKPAEPWLVPAFEHARPEVERVFVDELKKAIARAVKRGKTR